MSKLARVGIVGVTGYGGRELVRLLARHPHVSLTNLVSQSAAGKPFSDVVPSLRGEVDALCVEFDAERLAKECDVVFLAMPATKAIRPFADLAGRTVKVIDIGPDFRLQDPALYSEYYGMDHTATELLDEAVYGLPELYRAEIEPARLIAVPGCYPISVILALAPLLSPDCKVAVDLPIVVNALSGITGAGRSLNETVHFCAAAQNARAYKIGVHQHVPEIEQELSRIAGRQVTVQFTPYTIPLNRGILTTIVAKNASAITQPDLTALYAEFYGNEPFVRVLEDGALPEIRQVAGSNFCDIGAKCDERTGNIIVVSAIDNLVKGTAGSAVQCMNIMSGYDEGTGLEHLSLCP